MSYTFDEKLSMINLLTLPKRRTRRYDAITMTSEALHSLSFIALNAKMGQVPSLKSIAINQTPRPLGNPKPCTAAAFFSRSDTLLLRPAMPLTLSLLELSMLCLILLELDLRLARLASSVS